MTYEGTGEPGMKTLRGSRLRASATGSTAPTRRATGVTGSGGSGSAPLFTARVLTVLRQFEAVAQEGQQLVRGPEAELASRVDLFDPPGDAVFRRVRVGIELEDEGPSHRMYDLTAPPAHRRESRVQVGVKFV